MIAVDWGATRFRAYLLGKDGSLLNSTASNQGVLSCRGGVDYEQVLQARCGSWLRQAPCVPVLMAGMIGSRQGWVETPYIPCPLHLHSLGEKLVEIPNAGGFRLFATLGISNLEPSSVPDVIRGEETQLIGLQSFRRNDDTVACFPGTHSKWVQVEGGRVARFSTFMTGELFAAASRCESLAPYLNGCDHDELNEDAFLSGVRLSCKRGGLSHHLFAIRSRSLLHGEPCAANLSYLSGLLIGAEVNAALELYPDADNIAIVGTEELGKRYGFALAERSVATELISGQQAFVSGAWLLAVAGNLFPTNV